MDYKMEIVALLLCVIPAFVASITITPNGNSPEIKMVGGMSMDVQQDFIPMESKIEEVTIRTNRGKKRKPQTTQTNSNSTKLSINERYRRLIPYMTFYYANDLAAPVTDNVKEVEVEKAQILEASGINHANNREPKKIVYSNRNIPRYQGNRLTQHNIASANPTKIYYKGGVPVYHTTNKVSPNYNPLLSEFNNGVLRNEYENVRLVHKQVPKPQGIAFIPTTRKPYLNLYNEDSPNIRYYLSEKPKYKLVPYEQTPPVKVPENENVYDITKKPVPVSVLIPKEHVYVKPRPARPHYVYDNIDVQQPPIRKQPSIVSESYYEKQRPQLLLAQPIVQSGFKPIVNSPQYSKEPATYTTSVPDVDLDFENQKYETHLQSPQSGNYEEIKPHYYQYVVDQAPTYKPPPATSNTAPLASLLNSLQLNKSIPKPITKENVSASIRTLLQVLNVLKAVPQSINGGVPVLSTPKPFVASELVKVSKPSIDAQSDPEPEQPTLPDAEFPEEPYLAPVNTPSQQLDELSPGVGSSQHFPLQQASDDEGGTPGRPGIDYPILTTIPTTSFDCKTQRYKGFFADPETRCQVWHYCDLNGGQASFLCPNGTIFSQAGLTCDWWFNVRCATTTQLYVLNESLYKYILPHSPKFPEDYSGPLVDKYLTLKFKEMEEEFKKNKNKQSVAEKSDSDEESDDSDENSTEKEDSSEKEDTEVGKGDSPVSETSVIVDSPGESGKVERLQE
ncbi:unnamed protein product [Spodoptera littoralis]|uniref:Chitin-binding type-2 domain-containing protein n=1 Tax=Spodoptera littoralis TaxID=7109 RepID=A0A9P0HWT7_SPOLI|nr:unnamed protein product [Spodoptera littoralis]CAH1635653.1 unnamed protein product [Spodoptera littoralis]